MCLELDKDKKFLVAEDKDGNMCRFCEAVYITKNVTDLLTMEQKINLKVYNQYHERYVNIPMSRGELDGNIGSKLRKYGLSINIAKADSTETFYDFLLQTEKEAQHVYQHKKLGFAEVDGERCFLAHKPIGLKGEMNESEYEFTRKTKPKGTLKDWKKIIRDQVLGRPNLELALALGVVAPVAHILRENSVISDLPMYAFSGPTSVGKTIDLRIIASIYGKPAVGNGLITNMHSTNNALFAQMASNYGLPTLYDEVTGVVNTDLTGTIYYLPNGRDKMRCNSDGTIKEPIEFSGAIFFSSEKSLFDSTANTRGLRARLAEFNLRWTTGKTNAELLERELQRNYGTAVYPLISWLLNHDEWLQKKFTSEYNELVSMAQRHNIKVTNVVYRVLKMYALILVSAGVISCALKLPMMIEEMRKLLIKCLAENAVTVASVEEEYEELKNFVLEKYSMFPSYHIHPAAITSNWGFVKRNNGVDEYWIRKNVFEKKLDEISNRDKKTIVKELANKGWLREDDSRHKTFKSNFAGVSSHYYCLRIEKFEKTDDNPALAPKIIKTEQLKTLLA